MHRQGETIGKNKTFRSQGDDEYEMRKNWDF